ncbi:MAG: hypothetical protein Q8M83_05355, partial [bacterium]|nr:hypothetical protein [bacterium]
ASSLRGKNSAFPLLNKNEASPATCLNTWKAGHHRKILFSLREKEIWHAQNEKSKEYFSVLKPLRLLYQVRTYFQNR